MFDSNKPSLLKVISNKGVVHISQSAFDNTFHGLEQKWLMLRVYILHTLQQNQKANVV